jgi:hypothetical protein
MGVEEGHCPSSIKHFPLPLFKGEGGLRGMGFYIKCKSTRVCVCVLILVNVY